MKPKVTFIVNSKNVKKCKNLFDKVQPELSKKFEVATLYTESMSDGINKAKKATEEGSDYLVVVGGDGTINEVVNGILSANTEKTPILDFYACGTGDDFIKSLGLRNILQSFEDLKVRDIDVLEIKYNDQNGQKQSRYCVNIGDVGVSALTVKIVNGSKKQLGSALTFFVGALRAFLSYKHHNLKVTGDDFEYNGKITTVAFANGKFFGGGMAIAPDALIDDGIIDVTLVGDVSTFTFIKKSLQLRKLKQIKHPQVFYYKTKNLKISSNDNKNAFVEADGEFFGYTPVEVSVLSKKIKILQ